METETTASRMKSAILPTLLVVLSLASAGFIMADYVLLGFVAKGATLVGRELGGMSEVQVRAAIEEAVAAPSMLPFTITGDNRSWTLDPKPIVKVDADAMTSQAYKPSHTATLFTRMVSRIAGQPLPATVEPVYTVDKTTLERWVRDTAVSVDRVPVDATRTVANYAIRITPAVYGASVEVTKAVDVLADTLTSEAALATTGSRVASLPIAYTPPKVVETKFKSAIVVDVSACKVYLYDGATLVKTYRCAPGQPAWPTPKGDFKVVKKLANAPWYNPHSSWSASMPDRIPGGPGNPMGDRKIGIDYPGIFLHGIPRSEYSSIGTHASHGCMRMLPVDIHDLYPRVRIGDPVFIRE